MCKVPVSLSVCVPSDLFTHSEIRLSKQHILTAQLGEFSIIHFRQMRVGIFVQPFS